MSTSKLHALVSGAGIGGPVAAYWLAKAGHEVTVVERAPRLRKEGQTVDVRKEGLQIVEWMGIRKTIDERTTKEVGMRLVDDQDNFWASFPVSGDRGFTSEVEIVRGELASLFYDASEAHANYVFGTTIDDLMEADDGVEGTLKGQSGGELQRKMFDVVIAAEGLYSRTRAKAFNESISAPVSSLGLFAASYSIPATEGDTLWANGCMNPGGRLIVIRPDGFGRTRVTLSWSDDSPESRAVAHPETPTEKQKEFVRLRFRDLQSSTMTRLLDGLAASDDRYLAEIGQTKATSWSRGRVALVGDSAFFPPALTGMGTTTAIVGAYVLAAELVRNPTDHGEPSDSLP